MLALFAKADIKCIIIALRSGDRRLTSTVRMEHGEETIERGVAITSLLERVDHDLIDLRGDGSFLVPANAFADLENDTQVIILYRASGDPTANTEPLSARMSAPNDWKDFVPGMEREISPGAYLIDLTNA